jgi:hypothetical protein
MLPCVSHDDTGLCCRPGGLQPVSRAPGRQVIRVQRDGAAITSGCHASRVSVRHGAGVDRKDVGSARGVFACRGAAVSAAPRPLAHQAIERVGCAACNNRLVLKVDGRVIVVELGDVPDRVVCVRQLLKGIRIVETGLVERGGRGRRRAGATVRSCVSRVFRSYVPCDGTFPSRRTSFWPLAS